MKSKDIQIINYVGTKIGRYKVLDQAYYYQRDPETNIPHITVCFMKLEDENTNKEYYSVGIANWHDKKDPGKVCKKLGRLIATQRAYEMALSDNTTISDTFANLVLLNLFKENQNPEGVLANVRNQLKFVDTGRMHKIFVDQFLNEKRKKS